MRAMALAWPRVGERTLHSPFHVSYYVRSAP
ncbi:hypothetical protein HNP60_003217 [Sphingobium sp. B1D3A]|uniref:Uncharacterized protein n=1 Tax=Sphingobium lignivorans TaxID=2735886 RepID=A0ABR6NIY3_9SPHN|nr:hypothetical protein [Sphingobium lignivorans]